MCEDFASLGSGLFDKETGGATIEHALVGLEEGEMDDDQFMA